MKLPITVIMATVIVSGLLLGGVTYFTLAQDSTPAKVSGYVLDSSGYGIADAVIIFNVTPDVVPYVFSDTSGYYETYAPEGTYHVNVLPPFDSNFLEYDQPELTVGTLDISANITLETGYKLSGYLLNPVGEPVTGAYVALDHFSSGWYSNNTGYYFTTAPAGIYTLTIKPRTGTMFPTYNENDFILIADTVKNFTLVTSTSTTTEPTPTPSPDAAKISGYILDAYGNGISGAEIIFNVPEIVPAAFSDSSGYYEIFAPEGTYQVNVWPPFGSSFLSFEQQEFAVGTSDVSKNITLSTGYKLSGYLKDSSGSPIKGAIVALDQFHCGWYSKSSGEYFVTAPAGVYTVTVMAKGSAFETYKEYNFVLIGDTNKNFTLSTSTETTPDTTSKVKISGYILGADGNGVSGAQIIFNVPEIVPSTFSDSSGYYEVFAPEGTYHVNVWPPFDSNFLFFDQQEFAVTTSDVSKNITLSTGYKLSGYLKDTSGAPIKGALVVLGQFYCGWYSNADGRYFVTAPSGQYTLTIQAKTSPAFNTYREYNFVLNGDTNKDFTLVTSTESTPDTTSKVKISGYILDATGQGVSGAKIIFNVPEIVPSIFSGSSGYYEILAPAGTYHVNVWPPFNSNFLSYDEPEFAVGTSDVSKNITLSTGYKLSGYLKDSSGSPIKGAIVGLDQFHCGWYSTESGEYFVTAPAGTYTVTIRSRTGPAFDTYKEYSFVLAGDTNKDFTITLN